VLGPTSVPTTLSYLYELAAPTAGSVKFISVRQAGSSTGPAHVDLYSSTSASIVFMNTSIGGALTTAANLCRFEGRGGLTLVAQSATAWHVAGFYQAFSSSDSNMKFLRST